MYDIGHLDLEIPAERINKWQKTLDLLAQIMDIPAALIMRVYEDEIEVFISSQSGGNPYKKGERAGFGPKCGLYCEHVIRNKKKLEVHNALEEEQWKNNPDIELNMISYLGYSVQYDDGAVFGTICVLDNKKRVFGEKYKMIMEKFRDLVEDDLTIIRQEIKLKKTLDEVKQLKRLLPICSRCKKIRDDDGYWQELEGYMKEHGDVTFTHGLCPDCANELYGK